MGHHSNLLREIHILYKYFICTRVKETTSMMHIFNESVKYCSPWYAILAANDCHHSHKKSTLLQCAGLLCDP